MTGESFHRGRVARGAVVVVLLTGTAPTAILTTTNTRSTQ
nr:MAG TPA: hypothetical protein [Caudoviricetes sp.]